MFIKKRCIPPIKEIALLANSITNSFLKELNNTGNKKLNSDILADVGFNIIGKNITKEISWIKVLGITVTNNKIRDIKTYLLLKRNVRKITSQGQGILDFLRPLMTAGLPFTKSALTPLAKNVLILLELSASRSLADAAIQKKFMDQVQHH